MLNFHLQLPIELENQLNYLVVTTGKPLAYFAQQAFLNYLEDLADLQAATLALSKKNKVYHSTAEVLKIIRAKQASSTAKSKSTNHVQS
jgi:predicted DNA-binding protein